MSEPLILTLSCRNRPGIVSAVSTYLFEGGCNILDAQQFDDTELNRFFMRVVFNAVGEGVALDALRANFGTIAERFGMTWHMRARAERRRVMLFVSKFDHCLADLLYRWRIGEIAMDVAGIVANHPREAFAHLDLAGIDFHYLPVTRETKLEQEGQIWEVVRTSRIDLVVLARYMQVLSDGLVAKLAGRCINIHHSFLPGFKGARPYHQAHARGVKTDRRHRALRDLRSRRRADHRAGRGAHQPPRQPGGSGAQGSRHRTPGAGPRGAASPGGPGDLEWQQDGRVYRLIRRPHP